jgi:hypothetical protein
MGESACPKRKVIDPETLKFTSQLVPTLKFLFVEHHICIEIRLPGANRNDIYLTSKHVHVLQRNIQPSILYRTDFLKQRSLFLEADISITVSANVLDIFKGGA